MASDSNLPSEPFSFHLLENRGHAYPELHPSRRPSLPQQITTRHFLKSGVKVYRERSVHGYAS